MRQKPADQGEALPYRVDVPSEPVQVLRELTLLRRERAKLRDRERALVAAARREGVTWREVGVALGVSHQAVCKRFSKDA